MTQNEEYQKIIPLCKFISNEDHFYIKGTEAKFEWWYDYEDDDSFDNGVGYCVGMTNGILMGYDFNDSTPSKKGDVSSFSEFFIYDKYDNEISELNLSQYKELLKNNNQEIYWID